MRGKEEVKGTSFFQFNIVPVNILDPIQKCFGYSQLWPACSQNRAGSYMPDLTSCTRFGSVFPKKTWTILCKTDPDPIRMAWSGLGRRIWSGSKPMCKNHWALFLEGCNQPTTSFPLSDSVAAFHRQSRSHCVKPGLIRFGFGWLCQVLTKRIWFRSKPSGLLLANASEPIQIGCKTDPACLLG